jgi:hypothetical protein
MRTELFIIPKWYCGRVIIHINKFIMKFIVYIHVI